MKYLQLIMIFVLCAFCSCTQNDEFIPEPAETLPQKVTLNIGLGGELETCYSPLTRAVSEGLYGVQVYFKSESDANYKQYAYGLFDDPSKIDVDMILGYLYKIECRFVEHGKDLLTHTSKNEFWIPFYTGSSTPISNSFTYNQNTGFTNNDYGHAYLKDPYEIFDRPNISTYWGTVSEINPAASTKVNVNMKRVCFGSKFIAEGFTSGKMIIYLEKAPDLTITYPAKEVSSINTFYKMNEADDYSETIPVSITWEKSDGTKKSIAAEDLVFYRNKLTTVTIKIASSKSVGAPVSLNMETGDMTSGNNYSLDMK